MFVRSCYQPPYAETTCRRGFFGNRCTTRIVPPSRQTTTCQRNVWGDTTCRTTTSRPYSYYGPNYSSYSYSYDPYAYDHFNDYEYSPCYTRSPFASVALGILGITFLTAAFA